MQMTSVSVRAVTVAELLFNKPLSSVACPLLTTASASRRLPPAFRLPLSRFALLPARRANTAGPSDLNWRENRADKPTAILPPFLPPGKVHVTARCLALGPTREGWGEDGLGQLVGRAQWRCNAQRLGAAWHTVRWGCKPHLGEIWVAGAVFHSRRCVETCSVNHLRQNLDACSPWGQAAATRL